MSQAASQAAAFYREVVALGRVFTVLEAGNFIVFPLGQIEVVPFWSSRSRVERIQKEHPKYRAFTCDEISFQKFLQETLADLERESIHVGVNWSGRRLTGYDLSIPDLRKNLEYYQGRMTDTPSVERRPTSR